MSTTLLPDFNDPDLAHRVDRMTPREIDMLPFGAIRIDSDGKVSFYSATEARMSGRGDRQTVGLEFYTDVAPCMAHPGVKGRVDAARLAGDLDLEFEHVGDFADRQRVLQVRALSAAQGAVWLFIRRHG